MKRSQENQTTVNGDKVVWSKQGRPYIQHKGDTIPTTQGSEVGIVRLSRDGFREADLVIVEKTKRGRFAAGVALGAVLAVGATQAVQPMMSERASAAANVPEGNEGATPPPTTEVTTPIPTETMTPTTQVTAEAVRSQESCAAKLPLEVKVGQMTVWSVYSKDLDSKAAALNRFHIGGAIMMDEPADPKEAIAKLKSSQDIPLSVSIDQEGGAADAHNERNTVQRFRSLGKLPSQRTMASTKTSKEATGIMSTHYKKLKATGVDVVFAPVADVGPNLGTRSFSDDAKVATTFTEAYREAAKAAHVTPTLKHFPGLGRGDGNTDFKKDVTTPPADVIRMDWGPYRSVSDKAGVSVMVGSSITPGLTDDGAHKMAMFSKKTINTLRGELGFKDSVLYSDALNAEAVISKMKIDEAFVAATAAGVDAKVIVGTVGNMTLAQQMEANTLRLRAAIKEKKISETFVDEKVLRIFGQKGLNACSVLDKLNTN